MKKLLMTLMFVLVTTINGVAQMTQVEYVIDDAISQVEMTPPGTVYGVVENNENYYLINTPIGEYRIDKNKDGSFSILGVTLKLVSRKNNIYIVDTSLSKFEINLKKGTVKKIKNKRHE